MAKHHDRHWRSQCLAAAYLTLLALVLFAENAFSQGLSVRAPASATPGNAAVFGAQPNLIIDGGPLGSGGSGIQTNGGTGINNVFSNATLRASPANVINVTNDTANNNGSMSFEWANIEGTLPSILYTGTNGTYGFIDYQANHDGSPPAPSKGELRIESANNISIIPNTFGGAGGIGGHVQFGLNGSADYYYFNFGSNEFVFPFAAPSKTVYLRTGAVTNGNLLEWDPGFAGRWKNGASNTYASQFNIFHDTGYFGSPALPPDVNKEMIGIQLEAGTNVATLYSQVQLFGRLGTTTNSLLVGSNQISVSGNLVDTAIATDTWTAPHLFGAGSFGTSDFEVNGELTIACVGDVNSDFRVANGAGGGLTQSYFASGPDLFGSLMYLGGLAIGGTTTAPGPGILTASNSIAAGTNGAAPANVTLYTAGALWAVTNAAPTITVPSGGLHTIANNTRWTNDLGGKADLIIPYAAVSSTNYFAFTNTSSGDCFTNLIVATASIAGENTNISFIVYPDISANDFGSISNYGPAGFQNISLLNPKWKLR